MSLELTDFTYLSVPEPPTDGFYEIHLGDEVIRAKGRLLIDLQKDRHHVTLEKLDNE